MTATSAATAGASAQGQATRRTIGQITFVDRGTVDATARTEVPIALENSYAHWCELHMNNDGLIRERRAT